MGLNVRPAAGSVAGGLRLGARAGGRVSARVTPRAPARLVAKASSPVATPATGGPGGPTDGSGGDGGGGGGGGSDGNNAKLMAILAAAGKTLADLPAEIAAAVEKGKISVELLERYLALEANWLYKPFMKLGAGLRGRLLMDPGFLLKLGIEVGVGIGTKTAAEVAKRGDNFSNELDFYFANLVMALIADYMLVYLPAPMFRGVAGPQKAGLMAKLQKAFADCPGNMFQKVPAGQEPWTLTQRLGAPLRNGIQLVGVGFMSSMIGVALTNCLLYIKKAMDPTFVSNPPQNVATMAVIYGLYMGSSSNLRYQTLAGLLEERGVEVVFKNMPAVRAALTFALRTGNTFLGSLLWVDFLRLCGQQK
ncbi:unnamed protein product [Pedinophyceae sp. YPF-701]|nr:unnamed protein product [Pedinophyceae sp. YPF-701]